MYYIGTPASTPAIDAFSPLDIGSRVPRVFPNLSGCDRLLAHYVEFGVRRLVVCRDLGDIGRLIEWSDHDRVVDLRWFTGLPLPASPLDDPSIETVTVLGRNVVRRGDRVKHYSQRWTGCATATVIGFYNERGATNPWMRVLALGDNPSEYFSQLGHDRGWDYDRTQAATDVV